MYIVDDHEFDQLISAAIDELPSRFTDHLEDVAIVIADDPSPQQRVDLKLRCNQSLFGLYEGVPLTGRSGRFGILPSKITLFKNPMSMSSDDFMQLKKQIKHTLWHEIAHHYGLGHDRIHALEK